MWSDQIFGGVCVVEIDVYSHLCCAADVVAASMFLQRLEMHEIRDFAFVVDAGCCACCFSSCGVRW